MFESAHCKEDIQILLSQLFEIDDNQKFYLVEVKDNDMSPTIEDGDMLAVIPITLYVKDFSDFDLKEIEERIVLVSKKGTGVDNFAKLINNFLTVPDSNETCKLRRLKKVGNKFVLLSDNRSYPSEKIDDWEIIGVAIKRKPKPQSLI